MEYNVLPSAKRNVTSGTGSLPVSASMFAAWASIADAVYCVDTAGRILFANAAFEAMSGYALAELRGAPSTHLYVPEVEALFTKRRRQIYGGAAVSPYLETVLLLKDGRQMPVELSVSSLIAEGQIAGRVVVVRDITARQQSKAERQALTVQLEMELADAQRLQAISTRLYEGSGEALYPQLLDAAIALMRSDMGSMQMFDADRGELRLLASKGFHPESAAFWQWVGMHSGSCCGQALRTGQRVVVPDIETCAFMVGTPDLDAYRRSDVRAVQSTPLLARSGRLLGMLSTHWCLPYQPSERDLRLLDVLARQAADLIERAQTEQALFQQEKLAALGTLLASVAHELNNPLSVATMEIDNLAETWPAEVEAEALDTLRQAVERCKSVVQSFLALARQQAPERRAVTLQAVIDEVLVLLAHTLEVDGITIERHLADDLPKLWADVNQLHHMIANLLTNAHHALRQTAPPRHLRLTAAATADRSQVILEVADSGPGMPLDVQRRIFEPFFTTKSPGEGSGLGLPLCRNIVEGHGGAIRLVSQPGQGTTVSVTLPVAALEGPSPETTPEPVEPAPTASARVLLIDDEPGVQRALMRLLKRGGHDITTAANGQEGLAALETCSYEVILCDMRMPDLDGPGFYRELERRYPHLVSRVVFLTGDVLSSEAAAFFAQVDRPRLEKPFRAREMRQVIEQVLEAQ